MHNGRKTSDVSLFLPAASSPGSGMEEEAKPSLRTCEAKQPERPSTPDLLKILLGKQNIKTNNVEQITKKIISQNWCSQRKFSQLTQLVKASPSLMVVLVVSQEYKYGMILSFLFPSIIYSVLYTEVGHRSGSLGLFCGRRPRQAVHKLPMLLLP